MTDDSKRIEEWGKEIGKLWLNFVKDRPGQKLGVDFTIEDLPYLAIDLPSRRKAVVRLAAQETALVENLPAPQV